MNHDAYAPVDDPSLLETIRGMENGPRVRVIVSARRKKTVSGRYVGDVLEVRVPVGLSRRVRDAHIRDIAKKLNRKRASEDVDLEARSVMLAKRYDLPVPSGIQWSARQNSRWGSCTPFAGSIRISNRLANLPLWVLDYVIVHELAHLIHHDHGAEFDALVRRYPRAERAEGFLEAVSLGYAQFDGSLPTRSDDAG